MRPILKPALRLLRRDATTLQIGVDPAHAVVVADLDADDPTLHLFALLDGTRSRADLARWATARGVDPSDVLAVLDGLVARGAVDDATDVRGVVELDPDDHGRLGPDLDALALVHPAPGAGRTALRKRQAAVVRVEGAGRLGASVAALLSAAGVGRVDVDDDREVHAVDVTPSGHRRADIGARRSEALVAAWPSAHVAGPDVRGADVVVLASGAARAPERRHELMRDGVTHLPVVVRETVGTVGPLVVPGSTACMTCVDLHRTDQDRAWPLIAAQLAGCDGDIGETVLTAQTAGLAALQVLALLDGAERPLTADGTLEVRLPQGACRRREWVPHPACGCRWDSSERTMSA